MRVSVVIPAFDAEATVGGAISSALWQTYRDLEVVVVDDGSRDGTNAIAAAFPDPVRAVRQENAGVAAARNRGIAEAKGELIAFCDADDVLLPRHLEELVATYDRHGGGIATSNCYWLFPGGIHPSRTRYKGGFPKPNRQRLAILQQNFVSTMSLFPKRLADELGGFATDLEVAEDWDFWLRSIYSGARVSLQPRPLAHYRWGSESLSAEPERMDEHAEAVLRRAAGRDDLSAGERAYLDRRLSGPGPAQLGRLGDEALRAGRYREAAASYRRAASLCPAEPRLVWKARVLRAAPWLTGPLVRVRQLKIEDAVGFDEGHVR
ncbi:MAG TPA: glycosyltransferase [Gaiellaceae bacterium]|nr:glycosyltransferase [Gaiellaceae bacterium]